MLLVGETCILCLKFQSLFSPMQVPGFHTPRSICLASQIYPLTLHIQDHGVYRILPISSTLPTVTLREREKAK